MTEKQDLTVDEKSEESTCKEGNSHDADDQLNKSNNELRNEKRRLRYSNRVAEQKLKDNEKVKIYCKSNRQEILKKANDEANKTIEEKVIVSEINKKYKGKLKRDKFVSGYKSGLVANKDFDEESIQENVIENTDLTCEFCDAKHFHFELPQDNKFSNCCHKGKVNLEKDPIYPKKTDISDW